MKRLLLILIHIYRRYLSPLKPRVCRFYPTCSSYGYDAITRHGVVRGLWYLVVRILKCHPFHPGGIDEVPARKEC